MLCFFIVYIVAASYIEYAGRQEISTIYSKGSNLGYIIIIH